MGSRTPCVPFAPAVVPVSNSSVFLTTGNHHSSQSAPRSADEREARRGEEGHTSNPSFIAPSPAYACPSTAMHCAPQHMLPHSYIPMYTQKYFHVACRRVPVLPLK